MYVLGSIKSCTHNMCGTRLARGGGCFTLTVCVCVIFKDSLAKTVEQSFM